MVFLLTGVWKMYDWTRGKREEIFKLELRQREDGAHVFYSLQFGVDDVAQDVGEGHKVIVIQEGVNGLLQAHQFVLFLSVKRD